jgi:DNA repair protein RecN (Recombination protein N)
MIEQLLVKDYILFDDVRVDFDQNMSVITGETGAGKSLLIDAIHLLSGERISGSPVRTGKEKATLQMVISGLSDQVKEMLEEQSIDTEDDTLIVTRTINKNGKSRSMLNGSPVTNAFVKNVIAKLIDIHSQMDTMKLLDPALQLQLLDQYAKNEDLQKKTEEAFTKYASISAKIKKLKEETFSDAELAFVTEQINEITALDAKPGELEELQEQIKEAEEAEKQMEDVSSSLYIWKKEGGLQDQLYEVLHIFKKSDSLADYAAKMDEMYYAIQEIFEGCEDKKDSLVRYEGNLDSMQSREYDLKKAFRKYGGSYDTMQAQLASLNERVDLILNRQAVFEKLGKEQKEAWKEYSAAAKALRNSRTAVSGELQKLVEDNAKDLRLENCRFEIRFSNAAPSKKGSDHVEFYASMNPGQPLTTIKQSASGGELSRLMLALKVVFQAENGIGTLIFDEIDTGVSGKVALAMGKKMHLLARDYQVLCITHLPSVALWADTHYRVSKEARQNDTITSVATLDEEQQIEELAIMANGSASKKAKESVRDLIREVRNG